MIIDIVEKWLRQPNRIFGVITCRFEFCQCRNFSIFCCQLLSKPFSHFNKQIVHILTLAQKNVCYQITRAYMCTYSLFRDWKKSTLCTLMLLWLQYNLSKIYWGSPAKLIICCRESNCYIYIYKYIILRTKILYLIHSIKAYWVCRVYILYNSIIVNTV